MILPRHLLWVLLWVILTLADLSCVPLAPPGLRHAFDVHLLISVHGILPDILISVHGILPGILISVHGILPDILISVHGILPDILRVVPSRPLL